MKRILSFLMIAAIVSIAIVSCKDDFNEEDFLALQHRQKMEQDSINHARNKADIDSTSKQSVQSYINALNEAGDLMSLTLLIRDNDVPVEGATVRLFSGTPESVEGGRTKAEQVATTNAQGSVTFDRVTIGSSSISISKTGYTSATALTEICCVLPPQPITVNVNGTSVTHYVVPEKQSSNLVLPIFSLSGSATATITGRVTIETDVTNRTPEIPQNLTIRGNFNSIVTPTPGGNATVLQYSFEDSNFGTATVNNTTGEYSMTVPASVSGYNVSMVFPTIETNQHVAVAFVDGVAIPTGPEYRDVLTTFGPNAGTYAAVPAIFGAKAVFAAPPAPGKGFSISTPTAVGRSLPSTIISNTGTTTVGNVSFHFMSRGHGFSSSPDVNITGGGGTGAEATSSLRGKIMSANVSNGGSGYAPSTNFDILFFVIDENGDPQFLAGPINVVSTAGGSIPTGDISLPFSAGFGGHPVEWITGQDIASFGVKVVANGGTVTDAPMGGVTNATISFTHDNEVNSIAINETGSGYTSAPAIEISGGGTPTTQASLSISAFRTQFDFTLNSTNTTPYRVLPSDFSFTFPANAVDGLTVQSTAMVNRTGASILQAPATVSLISQLMTDGTNIMAINNTQGFRTSMFSVSPPTLTIIDRPTARAVAYVNVSSTTGQVTGLEDPNTGAFPVGAFVADAVGGGYDSYSSFMILPSIATAPGTGAQVDLTLSQADVNNKVVAWSGASTLVSGGSGYLDELNQMRVSFPLTGISARTATVTVPVSAGQTSVFNYNYGSGVPKTNIAGSFR